MLCQHIGIGNVCVLIGARRHHHRRRPLHWARKGRPTIGSRAPHCLAVGHYLLILISESNSLLMTIYRYPAAVLLPGKCFSISIKSAMLHATV